MTQNADSAVLHVLSVQTNTSCSFAVFSFIGLLFGKAKQEKKEQKVVAVVLISTAYARTARAYAQNNSWSYEFDFIRGADQA